MTKILILGHGRHGKDTVAKEFTKHGFKFQSSSRWCAEHVVYPAAVEQYPLFAHGKTWEFFYENRHDSEVPGCGRKFWYETIAEFSANPDNVPPYVAVLEEADMYVGIRKQSELNKALPHYDYVIWVEDIFSPPEDLESMDIKQTGDYIVWNHKHHLGDFEDMPRQVTEIVKEITK